MKKKFLLLFCLTTFAIVNAQDITVFDFDGITPTVSSWADTFVGVPNPASDATNGSVNVGKYTHLGQYSTVVMNVDIDPRFYTSFDIDVYSPSAGKITVVCQDANNKELIRYSQDVSVSTGWTKLSKELAFTTKIAKVEVVFNSGQTPKGTAEDVVYLDNLIFKKTTNTFLDLYKENFFASWSEWGKWTGAPSTQTGKWLGAIDLQSSGDAEITLDRLWNNDAPYGHVLRMQPTSPTIEISGVNINGFDNIRLVFDNMWPWSDAENATFWSAGDAEKMPVVEYKSGVGAWTTLTAAAFSGSWQTQSLSIDGLDDQQPLSIRFSKAGFTYYLDNVMIQGSVKMHSTGLNNEHKESLVISPNPAKDYFVIPEAQNVIIVNLTGHIVKEISNAETVDVSDLQKGVYIVRAQVNNATYVSKLIKE
jgi:hypothetical protein